MSDDRELLEKAAQAAGLILNCYPDEDFFRANHSGLGEHWNPKWNPLADDGDALRLALRLRMTVRHDDVDACIAGWHANQAAPTLDGMGPWFWKEWNGNDPAAATRRAIVRAAAALAGESQG